MTSVRVSCGKELLQEAPPPTHACAHTHKLSVITPRGIQALLESSPVWTQHFAFPSRPQPPMAFWDHGPLENVDLQTSKTDQQLLCVSLCSQPPQPEMCEKWATGRSSLSPAVNEK